MKNTFGTSLFLLSLIFASLCFGRGGAAPVDPSTFKNFEGDYKLVASNETRCPLYRTILAFPKGISFGEGYDIERARKSAQDGRSRAEVEYPLYNKGLIKECYRDNWGLRKCNYDALKAFELDNTFAFESWSRITIERHH